MNTTIVESTTTAPVRKGTRWQVRVIEAGKGSSGVYPAEMLERNAFRFPAGTHVYLDHPTESERYERPERSVRDLIGAFVTEATYDADTQSLVAEVEFFSDYSDLIVERAEDIGMSLHAFALSHEREDGEIEIDEFLEVYSVDVVTRAGAGGALISLLESARKREQEVVESVHEDSTDDTEENGMNEEQEALLRQVAASVAALAPAPAPETEEGAPTGAPDPLAVAEALATSDLSAHGRRAVVEAVRGGAELEEAIKAQESYEAEIKESAKTPHVVQESTGRKIAWTGGKR